MTNNEDYEQGFKEGAVEALRLVSDCEDVAIVARGHIEFINSNSDSYDTLDKSLIQTSYRMLKKVERTYQEARTFLRSIEKSIEKSQISPSILEKAITNLGDVYEEFDSVHCILCQGYVMFHGQENPDIEQE